MTSQLGGYFDIESTPVPPAVHHKEIPASSPVELDDLTWGARINGPYTPPGGAQTPYSGTQTPRVNHDFTISRPPTPKENEVAGFAQTWSNPPMNKWRILSIALIYFGNGMNDSAPGALLPSMEIGYNIGYAIVSLVFVGQAIGFISAAFFTDALVSRFGRAKAMMLAEFLVAVGFAIIVATPPFAVVVVAYFVVGLGYSINLALGNVFCANLADATVILGLTHGSYGVGGTVGPIIATAMVSHGILWSRYYLITLGTRVISLSFVGWAFWKQGRETPTRLLTALELTASRQAAVDSEEPTKRQLFRQSLRNRVTILGALFTFAYQGAEVSISGWVISFLITYRGGDPAKVGYVTAGFWVSLLIYNH